MIYTIIHLFFLHILHNLLLYKSMAQSKLSFIKLENIFFLISFSINPYHVEFLNGIIHLTFLALSVIILRDIKMKVVQPTVQSLVRLHRCAGWPKSILVAGANHFGVGRIRVKTNFSICKQHFNMCHAEEWLLSKFTYHSLFIMYYHDEGIMPKR